VVRIRESFLQYIDEEGEKVVVGSEYEWEEAVAFARRQKSKTVKLFVKKGTPEFHQSWANVKLTESVRECGSQGRAVASVTSSIATQDSLRTIGETPEKASLLKEGEPAKGDDRKKETQEVLGFDIDKVVGDLLARQEVQRALPVLFSEFKNGVDLETIAKGVVEKHPSLLEINGVKRMLPHLPLLQRFLESQWTQLKIIIEAMARSSPPISDETILSTSR